jgi:hypothetical protein
MSRQHEGARLDVTARRARGAIDTPRRLLEMRLSRARINQGMDAAGTAPFCLGWQLVENLGGRVLVTAAAAIP